MGMEKMDRNKISETIYKLIIDHTTTFCVACADREKCEKESKYCETLIWDALKEEDNL